MPVAAWVGAASPYAPSVSLNGFISSGSSATCDLPSGPLYTRQNLAMLVVSSDCGELRAAPGHVALARGGNTGVRDVRCRRPFAGHRRAMHDPTVDGLVPRTAAVQHTAVVPHDHVPRPPPVRVDHVGLGG